MASRYVNFTQAKQYNVPEGYKLVPAVDPEWREAEMRLAIVLESVDSADLKAGTLYLRESESSVTSVALSNTLRYARAFATKVTQVEYAPCLAVVNWNAAKTYHLDEKAAHSYYSNFSARVQRILEDLNPTHVLVCGDKAARSLLPDIKHLEHKRGWVFKRQGIKWCATLNIEQLVTDFVEEDENDDLVDVDAPAGSALQQEKGKNADLLFYVARNLANLVAGKHLFSVAKVRPNPVYVDTIEKFDKLYAALVDPANQHIALDTETRTLESYDNDIYIIQFAFSSKKGFVVPIDHPKTPFSTDECRYIKKKLRRLFAEYRPDKLKTFLVLNGAFDFRIIRAQLGINVIHHRVHEISAGETLIDENLGVFTRVRLQSGKLESRENLRAILTSYDNDWYFTASFSKEERNTTGLQEPNDPALLAYCSADVIFLHAIAEQQFRMASALSTFDYQKNKNVPYLPFYRKHLINQMGDTALAISTLEQHGSYVDLPYMLQLLGENSELKKALAGVLSRFRKLPNVIKANKIIAKREGTGSASALFGQSPFVLSLTKAQHKLTLFIDVLGLKPLSFTKTKQPQIDKRFNNAYARKYPEVSLYSEFQVITKLLSTYVRGWVDKLHKNADSRKDHRFRARYSFFRIVTGRLLSFDPNHQQIPSRGSKAKAIKRTFIAPKRYIQIRADYSAHEVRFWAILAKDTTLAKAFQVALTLKKQLTVLLPGEDRNALFEELKKKGDVHIQNVKLFFGMWVDKNHPYRDSIKQVVFGLIYGKLARTLARDLYEAYIVRLKLAYEALDNRRIAAEAYTGPSDDSEAAKDRARLKVLTQEAQEALDALSSPEKTLDDFQEEAESLVEKVFSRFAQGKKHLDRVSDQIVKDGWVSAPTGRRRNMFRVFTGKKGILSAAIRAAKNAPIQGVASEVALRSAYAVLKEADLFLREIDYQGSFPLLTRVVHDASYYEVPYDLVVPFVWIYQYVATTGVTKLYEEDYGYKFIVEPEIEMEFSAQEDKSYKWNWTLDNLREILEKCLKDQIGLRTLNESEYADALNEVLAFARNKERMRLLQERYPLLGVDKLPAKILRLLTQ